MTVKIVTDSTSDIPPELAKELGIAVVPLTVFFGEEAFKDGIDMTHDEFFQRLTTGAVLPRTTQPTIGDFLDVYKSLADQGHEIVSIHISDKLSGTLNSARGARQELPDAKIELVDTRLASMAMTLVAKAAAEAASSGADFETVAQTARDVAGSIDLFVVLDTLEYLQKGGRIGKAQSVVGSLLSLKPILSMVDGEIHPHEKVRTRSKALQRMMEIASEGAPYEEVAFIHQAPEAEVAHLRERLVPLTSKPVLSGRIGPVVGTYAGPGAIGIALRKQ